MTSGKGILFRERHHKSHTYRQHSVGYIFCWEENLTAGETSGWEPDKDMKENS
jgi:hypothetical protein